ncbi:hypothetical protein ENSA5_06710 [Enhygromyxa salina]|uniref:Uncharacterized protein n=1 Tax=Enhygromyxa salina TaxID=215803 RepID=A0A2S9YHG1_9BACT|nr:hypothetical protein [Enhygromyxa salina]PRQ04547.1 hypothetical protein ENSA5_06710 [Enhygromyxa salina]
MNRAPLAVVTLGVLLLTLPGCKKEAEPEPKQEEKKAEPAPEPEPEPVEPRFDLSGPKPPETSTVVFSVEGALQPMACFDKDKGGLASGADCVGLVAEGSEVYMESSFGTKALSKTGAGTKTSTCADEGAIPTAELDGGADYDWGVWPKSLAPEFTQISPDTWSDRGARLDEAETKAVQEAMAKIRNVQGEFQPKQRATADIDGDGKDELFASAVLINPADPDTYLVSGLFMAPGGDLANLQLIDQAKKGADVIKLLGAVDLDGDGKRELWTGITFDGGAGERIVQLGDKPTPLGKWTCGAGS